MRKLLTIIFGLLSLVGLAQTNVTMTQLRAVTSATPGQTYFVTDAGKQGLYRYDNTDVTTRPNTGTVVIANEGTPTPIVTWNPADKYGPLVLSNGNLRAAGVVFSEGGVRATLGRSTGKWYWEVTVTALNGSTNNRVGVGTSAMSLSSHMVSSATGWAYQFGNGNKINNGTSVAYGSSLADADVIGIALDMDAGELKFYKNGTDLGVAYTGLTGELFPAFSYSDNTSQVTANFGATAFTYSIPSGFSAIGGNGIIPGLRMKRLNPQGNYINATTDTVNITWFGCNGTDTTFDNTDTLEMIIGWNFKRILIPDGIFRVDFNSLNNKNAPTTDARGLMVRANQHWIGLGTHRSIFMMDGVINETPSTYYHLFMAVGGLDGIQDTCDYTAFKNFTIRGKNYNYSVTNSLTDPSGIMFFASASHALIDSCKFEYIYGHGANEFNNAFRKGGYSTVRNSIARYCSKNGFNMNAPYLTFEGNYGYRNHFSLLEASTGNSIIRNNVAEECGFIGIGLGGFGDEDEANEFGLYNIVHGNVTFGSITGKGLHLAGGNQLSLMFNNTAYYNAQYGFGFQEDLSNIDIGVNEVYTRRNYAFNNISYDNGEVGNATPLGFYVNGRESYLLNNTIYRTGIVNWRGRTFNQQHGIITSAGVPDIQIANNNVYGNHNFADYYLRLGNNRIWLDTGMLAGRNVEISVDPRTAEPRTWSQVFGSLNLSSTTAYEPSLTGIDPNSLHTLQLDYNTGSLDSVSIITTRPPTIELGNDTTVTSLANFTLTSSASDVDGSIASYQWHIMRRPYQSTSDILTPTSATATLDSLSYGEYYVMCEVTDNRGAKNVDYRIITFAEDVPNVAPNANAGIDQTITLPTSQVTLSGTATDSDGTISTYAWTKLTGTGGTITSPSSASTTVTGLTAGTYTFRLLATDNDGATDADTIQVSVSAAPSVNEVVANCTITNSNKNTLPRVYRFSWQAPNRVIYRLTMYSCGGWIRERWINNNWAIIGYQ
jgi:hypothetical protein